MITTVGKLSWSLQAHPHQKEKGHRGCWYKQLNETHIYLLFGANLNNIGGSQVTR